jgi:beta-galactosidase/beta-glucuronidase
VRDDWLNLNGTWEYSFRPRTEDHIDHYDGAILVPFPVESSLSGVCKALGPEERLWYRREFSIPDGWAGKHVMLHLGAVDWQATVRVNGHEVGTHEGGYTPFSFDISAFLDASGTNQVEIVVWDPTDTELLARGKQNLKPKGIFYTSVSGIWQTVWIEPVPETWLDRLKIVPDLDHHSFSITPFIAGEGETELGLHIEISVLDGGTAVASGSCRSGESATFALEDPKLWAPSSPFLYDIKARLVDGKGDVDDEIKSYAGLRKIHLGKDEAGVPKLLFNNEPLYQLGVLDQGYWPDGLYTAPTDEALRSDIEMVKQLGFNMIRKHVKVEPDRWYFHCDRLGILVWQDMPSICTFKEMLKGWVYYFLGKQYKVKHPGQRFTGAFLHELDAMVQTLFNHPSIVTWVPFNEGWGQEQFDSRVVVEGIMKLDPYRLVDNASGWFDRKAAGHVRDVHWYPGPKIPRLEKSRAAVNGEFGGLGYVVLGHCWSEEGGWGYRKFKTIEQLRERYTVLQDKLDVLKRKGLSASVYTQLTDVEGEVNGLLTYDREIVKIPSDR